MPRAAPGTPSPGRPTGESTGLRRGLQVALGLVWLLDAALQYQPYMFTRAFPGHDARAVGAAGEPGIRAGPVRWPPG